MVGRFDRAKFVEEVERAVANVSDRAGGLFLFSFGDAGQAKLAAIAKIEPDLDHQDRAKALQGASPGDGLGHCFELLLETDPQALAQKGY